MSTFALALIIAAAFCHAFWNLLTKQARGGSAFIWLFTVLGTVLYFPLALWVILTAKLPNFSQLMPIVLLSAALHSFYYFALNRGYRFGDLSLIYPLARGSAPLITITAAIILLGEPPTASAIGGGLLITCGVLMIAGNPFANRSERTRKSIFYALLCGCITAAYSVVDKVAVSSILVPPLLMDWATNAVRALILAPYAYKNFDAVKEQWQQHKKEAFGVAILSPLAYILVLTALSFSPVSYIAPAREVSILIGTILGARLLAEGNIKLRLTGAAIILIGLFTLALA